MPDKKAEKVKETPEEERKRKNREKSKKAREKNKLRAKESNIDPSKYTRICAEKCNDGKPLQLSSFPKDVTKKLFHGYTCKDCKNKNAKEKAEKDEKFLEGKHLNEIMKECVGPCGQSKPLTEFNSSKGTGQLGFANVCKECRELDRREHLNTEKQTEGTKYCNACFEYHDVSEFYGNVYSEKDGLQSVCKKWGILRGKKSNSTPSGYSRVLMQDVKKRCGKDAKVERGITNEINKNFILTLFKRQKEKCCLTGIYLTHTCMTDRTPGDCHIINPFNMSIDRIDSSKGYTKDNVRLVGAVINAIKWTLDDDMLRKMCLKITYHAQYLKFFRNNQSKQNQFIIRDKDSLKFFALKRLDETKPNAEKRKLDVDIYESDLVNKFKEQNGLCALSGIKLTYDFKNKNKFTDISIDRINSKKGYSTNNVQLVCGIVNKLKLDLPNDKFVSYCKSIYYGMITNEVKKVKAFRY